MKHRRVVAIGSSENGITRPQCMLPTVSDFSEAQHRVSRRCQSLVEVTQYGGGCDLTNANYLQESGTPSHLKYKGRPTSHDFSGWLEIVLPTSTAVIT